LLIDTSQSAEFSATIRRWLAECDYLQVQHVAMSVGAPGLADENRRDQTVRRHVQLAMPQIYNRVNRECATEYLWIVEDDIIPPDDACERLLRSFDADTASVAAPYRSRFHPGYVAWDVQGKMIEQPGQGVETVGGNGFGCVILRHSVLRDVVFHHGGRGDYDPNFYAELRGTRFRAKVDWSAECEHLIQESAEKQRCASVASH
jgi:hypothetical protein